MNIIKITVLTIPLLIQTNATELGGEDFWVPMNPPPAHINMEKFFDENEHYKPAVIKEKTPIHNDKDVKDAADTLIQLSMNTEDKK